MEGEKSEVLGTGGESPTGGVMVGFEHQGESLGAGEILVSAAGCDGAGMGVGVELGVGLGKKGPTEALGGVVGVDGVLVSSAAVGAPSEPVGGLNLDLGGGSEVRASPPACCKKMVWDRVGQKYAPCGVAVVDGEKFCLGHLPKFRLKMLKARENIEETQRFKNALRMQMSRAKKGQKRKVDLTREIGIARSIVEYMRGQMEYLSAEKGKPVVEIDKTKMYMIGKMADALETVSKLAERMHKINTDGAKAVDVDLVREVVRVVVTALRTHIVDRVVLRAIAVDLSKMRVMGVEGGQTTQSSA